MSGIVRDRERTAPGRSVRRSRGADFLALAGFCVVGAGLWTAAYAKTLVPREFERVLEESGLVPAALAPWVAVVALALEWSLPVALLYRPARL
ncbi:MAG: hypothetical protein IT208_07415 [Chthonomonadales bacterium]|nr:hypothetical protein [Chthonomonadales bacterium]